MTETTLTPPIKLIRIDGTQGGQDFTDWLLADEGVREFEAMIGTAQVYCQLGNEAIAKAFVLRVNAHDGLVKALREIVEAGEGIGPTMTHDARSDRSRLNAGTAKMLAIARAELAALERADG